MIRRTLVLLVIGSFLVSTPSVIATPIVYMYTADFNPSEVGLGSATTATAALTMTMQGITVYDLDVWADQTDTWYSDEVPVTSIQISGAGASYDGVYTGSNAYVANMNYDNALLNDDVTLLLYTDIASSSYLFSVQFLLPQDYWPASDDPTPLATFNYNDVDVIQAWVQQSPPFGENHTEWTTNIADYSAVPVPEPSTVLLLGTGLVGFVGARLRKKFKK